MADHPRGSARGASEARTISVTGVVQGVGFRPFAHRLAEQFDLAGWVRNESEDVRIVVEGTPAHLDAFVASLRTAPPPLARIDAVRVEPTACTRLGGFRILASAEQADRRQPVSPDVAMCAACAAELRDPANRRYRYAFTTCTDCGPRFTVIEGMPYDRERTSMRVFALCGACLDEYRTPADRRYRAESNSCPQCGPRVWFERDGTAHPDDPAGVALDLAARTLLDGGIVALRGLGGFHLAVDATNAAAVRRLRERKARDAKPLAVMVRSVHEARMLGQVDAVTEELLTGPERPIVLLRRRPDAALAPAVAPGLDTVGVVTAYTPLHALLLERVGRPLVMTSGNRREEPIAIGNDDARTRLGPIADALLLHDREIVARYDDSVVRVAGAFPVLLRRARGYAPLPVALPVPAPRPLVAVGPHLKNTFALAHGSWAYVSQHIGDLENLETLAHFDAALAAFRRLFKIEPEVVVRDRHPAYLSTRIAEDMGLGPPMAVQHHHAHVAAVAAEHGVTERVIGVAYDGTGYGDDGAVWGAEVFDASLTGYERLAHLRYAALPGAELAVRRPWRAALGYLALEPGAARAFSEAFRGIPPDERDAAETQIARGLNAPMASSMGRLFDAAAAVLGIRRAVAYDGQAAMELEAAAGHRAADPLPFPLAEEDGVWIMDPLPLLVALGERRAAGDAVECLAAAFHEAVAHTTVSLMRRLAEAAGLARAAVGGGVFQNARLLVRVVELAESAGLRVLVPRRLSPNDGAISYGQAAVAAARLHGGLP